MGAIAQNDQDPVATKTPDQTHEISNLLITEIPKDAPWRDILDALKQIQLGFANEHNYQLLIMAIEEGMLGKDGFNATIEGIRLDIQPGESDEDLRQKLAEFINSLCQFES